MLLLQSEKNVDIEEITEMLETLKAVFGKVDELDKLKEVV